MKLLLLALLALPVFAQQDRPIRLFPGDPNVTVPCSPVTSPIVDWKLARFWICKAPTPGANTGEWVLMGFGTVAGPSGRVLMIHDSTAGWLVFKEDGSLLSTLGSTTSGLQEALNYGWPNAYCVEVQGGGVIKASGFYASEIVTSSTITFPTGWGNCFHSYGVGYIYAGTTTNPFIVFNSMDFTEIDFHTSQVVYKGSAAAFDFHPTTDNGENFVGVYSSKISLPTIVPADINLAPDPTRGIGVRIRTAYVANGCAGIPCLYGNGLFGSTVLHINEVNGGLRCLQVDNPGAGQQFTRNKITTGDLHGCSDKAVIVGSATPTDGTILGNRWSINATPTNTGTCLDIWGGSELAGGTPGGTASGGDIYELSCVNGLTGVVFRASACHNVINVATVSVGGTAYVNSSNCQDNVINDAGPINAFAVTVGASPFVLQNQRMKPETVTVAGTTTSILVGIVDVGIDYIDTGVTAGMFTLKPGQFIKITYPGAAPSVREIW